MNRPFSILACISFLFISGFAAAQSWTVNTYDSLQFYVSSPEPLIKKTKESITELGVQVVHSFGLKPKDNANLIYQVIVMQYPDGSFPVDSVDLQRSVLESLVDDTANQESAELIYSESYGQQGIMGIQWRIHTQSEIVIRSKAFIYNDYVYVVQVMSEMTKSLNGDVDKFMESFQFMK